MGDAEFSESMIALFTDGYIFFNENVWISLKMSLKFIPKVRINNIPALV